MIDTTANTDCANTSVQQAKQKQTKKAKRYGLSVFILFFAIWGISFATILFTRGPRAQLPEWAQNPRTKCMDNMRQEWIAETDLYAEQPFSYTLLNSTTGVPVDLRSVFEEHTVTSSEKEKKDDDESDSAEFTRKMFSIITTGASQKDQLNIFSAIGNKKQNGNDSGHSYIVYVDADERIIKKGEVLFTTTSVNGKTERTFKPHLYKLLAYDTYFTRMSTRACNMRWALYMGLLSGFLMLSLGVFMFYMRKDFFDSGKELLLFGICLCIHIISLLASQLLFPVLGGGPSFYLFALMPMSLGPALISNLLGKRIAACSVLLLSVLAPILVGGEFQFQLFIQSVAYSIIGVSAFQNIHKRNQFLLGGIYIFLTVIASTLFYALQRDLPWLWSSFDPFWINIPLYAIFNALFVVVMMLVVPLILEQTLGTTTSYTFNELHDHPLLERLKTEAPGTYEHSRAVADIASTAARTINADAKITEVCAQFHDIGKLYNPSNFAENLLFGQKNPHDSLTPLESCAILREHVKHGLKLAQENRLPVQVYEAIEQHHGDGVMTGFYAKAVNEAKQNNSPAPNIKEYSYTGKRPQHIEVVLVFLTDFCEAAIRACIKSWDAPSAEKIREKVIALVYDKMKNDQLSEALITMADLKNVINSIVDSLCIIHHVRPQYATITEQDEKPKPETESKHEAQQPETTAEKTDSTNK